MKITAEFNSNEELVSFISAFGTKAIITGQTVDQVTKETVAASKSESKEEVKKETSKVESSKENTSKVNTEENTAPKEEIKEESKDKESKITKEMVRAIFTKIIKAGKQKEAKELTTKYGASKLPELKEEDYAAIYKDAEVLI